MPSFQIGASIMRHVQLWMPSTNARYTPNSVTTRCFLLAAGPVQRGLDVQVMTARPSMLQAAKVDLQTHRRAVLNDGQVWIARRVLQALCAGEFRTRPISALMGKHHGGMQVKHVSHVIIALGGSCTSATEVDIKFRSATRVCCGTMARTCWRIASWVRVQWSSLSKVGSLTNSKNTRLGSVAA